MKGRGRVKGARERVRGLRESKSERVRGDEATRQLGDWLGQEIVLVRKWELKVG